MRGLEEEEMENLPVQGARCEVGNFREVLLREFARFTAVEGFESSIERLNHLQGESRLKGQAVEADGILR